MAVQKAYAAITLSFIINYCVEDIDIYNHNLSFEFWKL